MDYKTSGCVDGLIINGTRSAAAAGRATTRLQLSATRRFHGGLTGGIQYQFSRNKGTTQGSNEAVTASNTFDYETEYGTNPTDIPHTFNGSLIYMLPFEGAIAGGWRVGGILNARSGVPINVTINRPDTVTIGGVTVTNIPWRQHARHAAAGPRAGRRSLPEGRRALAEPRGIRGADAWHVRQPAA